MEELKKSKFSITEGVLPSWVVVCLSDCENFSERSYFCAHSHLPHLERGIPD